MTTPEDKKTPEAQQPTAPEVAEDPEVFQTIEQITQETSEEALSESEAWTAIEEWSTLKDKIPEHEVKEIYAQINERLEDAECMLEFGEQTTVEQMNSEQEFDNPDKQRLFSIVAKHKLLDKYRFFDTERKIVNTYEIAGGKDSREEGNKIKVELFEIEAHEGGPNEEIYIAKYTYEDGGVDWAVRPRSFEDVIEETAQTDKVLEPVDTEAIQNGLDRFTVEDFPTDTEE